MRKNRYTERLQCYRNRKRQGRTQRYKKCRQDFNLKFNVSLFKNKQVILLDDVLNSGTGFIQVKRKLIELGAKSVIGVFLAKTAQEEQA